MDSRGMLIAFEQLIRNTNPDLAFDINILTDVIYKILSRSEEEYIVDNFLMGNDQENINIIRKKSDVLKNLIDRCSAVKNFTLKNDGGYIATFGTDVTTPVALTDEDFWMFLGGTMAHSKLPTNNAGFDGGVGEPRIDLNLVNHYDLQKLLRTVNNEPVYKYIPIVLEGGVQFAFYLDKEIYDGIGEDINDTNFHIFYLKRPVGIDADNQPSLVPSTHNDIVKRAVEIFLVEYKYKLSK